MKCSASHVTLFLYCEMTIRTSFMKNRLIETNRCSLTFCFSDICGDDWYCTVSHLFPFEKRKARQHKHT